MMTENNNPVVMTWFQQQQTPAGWFESVDYYDRRYAK